MLRRGVGRLGCWGLRLTDPTYGFPHALVSSQQYALRLEAKLIVIVKVHRKSVVRSEGLSLVGVPLTGTSGALARSTHTTASCWPS